MIFHSGVSMIGLVMMVIIMSIFYLLSLVWFICLVAFALYDFLSWCLVDTVVVAMISLCFLYECFFPKQLTVGVLNATLDLAALVLVGVVGFLGSEVVLSPVVSHCLRSSPFMWGVGVGWCGRLLGLWNGLVSRCLRLSPFMWGVGVPQTVNCWGS